MNSTDDKEPLVDWLEANQLYLTRSLEEVKRSLERRSAAEDNPQPEREKSRKARPDLIEAAAAMPAPPALEIVCEAFGLSRFERQVLLLCAGPELDSAFLDLLRDARGNGRDAYPSFSLACTALDEPHWSATSPAGPLRYWRLIEPETKDITTSRLRIDERILHFISGINQLDERLNGLVESVQGPSTIVPTHREIACRIASVWRKPKPANEIPAIHLYGSDGPSQRAVALEACALTALDLYVMHAESIPVEPAEREALIRLWLRESILSGSVLLLECRDLDASDAVRKNAVIRFAEGMHGMLLWCSRDRWSAPHRPTIALRVDKPTLREQQSLWKTGLESVGIDLDGRLESLVAQFNLNTATIGALCDEIHGRHAESENPDDGTDIDWGAQLWNLCRNQALPLMDSLAQKIEPSAGWNDLILPEAQTRILSEIAVHVRRRMTVYEDWGFAGACSRGMGISALFAGASGTGKTMAAEVLAEELRLDLYRIDLSQVVNKYIGETEKNLKKVFDAAEDGGVILLFDEADALFGKRSEVKDSHDRYANIEVSYLLQRMEAYRGLAILTTNMKNLLDSAFLRRIRFIVQFPFPDGDQRVKIWRGIFPKDTPLQNLDWDRLARLNVSGGSIRNIALHAAFLAADADRPVRMEHLLRAARLEYMKLEKSLTESEIEDWT